MWWVAPLVGAAMGAYLGKQKQKAEDDARKDQALINMYAPLFGKAPQPVGAREDKVTPGILQGAMAGYQMQSQAGTQDKLAQLYSGDTSTPTATSATPIVQQSVGTPYRDPYAYRANPLDFLGG